MKNDLMLVHEAMRFAAVAHEGQSRKDVELPYIVHPVSVMRRIASWGIVDAPILSAALLHDTIEDTAVTYELIRSRFGEPLAKLVNEVTRYDDLTYADKAEYMRSFANKSIPAVVIKIADRLCNVEDFAFADKEKYAFKYFWKAECVFDLLDIRAQEFIQLYDWPTLGKICVDVSNVRKFVAPYGGVV